MTMYVSGLAWAHSLRASALMMAVLCAAGQVQGNSELCRPAINVSSKYFVRPLGEPLELRCIIQTCMQKSSNVTWCKVESNVCAALPLDVRISFIWKEPRGQEVAHVLRFDSLQFNDSGYYKCLAAYSGAQIVSSIIGVNISAEAKTKTTTAEMPITNSTVFATLPPTPALEQFRYLLYVMVSAGGLCLIIITIALAVFCHRRRRKARTSVRDPGPAEEVQFLPSPTHSEHKHPLGPTGIEIPKVTIYDNAHLCRKPSAPSSPEEDSIVYADLNHDPKMTTCRFIESDDVEYATVHLH